MKTMLILLALCLQTACTYVETTDHHPNGSLHDFYYNNFDPHHPDIIDPYFYDGIFEVTWDFRHIDSDLSLVISLSSDHHHDHEIVLVSEKVITYSMIDYVQSTGFHYDANGALWQITNNGQFRYIANLANTFSYSEPLNLTIYACEADGDCYRASKPIQFW